MLLKNPDIAWSDIPDLPKAACALLEQQFSRCTSTVLRCQQSTGGDTTKLLIQLQDGMQVEAVVMHYDTSGACWPSPHPAL
jgi:adenine C2-methylase RlmN of 23S rRNA A2503 and tRNA A37